MQMTPAALQAAQNSMAARLHQQQQQQGAMPQGGGPRGLPGMLAGMPHNMTMRPHMSGFPNGPNGIPQVRPQQPAMPGQMMPPGMTPPQVQTPVCAFFQPVGCLESFCLSVQRFSE